MNIAVVCIAILASIVFVLGMNVSRLRGVRERAGGPQFPTDGSDGLFKAVRAHGNAAEYVPTLAILIALVGAREPAPWMVVAMVGATISRLVHAGAIYASPTLAKQTPLRLAAALGTYLFGLALVVALLVTTFGA